MASGTVEWISTHTRCDVAVRVSLMNQVTCKTLSLEPAKLVNATIELLLDSRDVGFVLRK